MQTAQACYIVLSPFLSCRYLFVSSLPIGFLVSPRYESLAQMPGGKHELMRGWSPEEDELLLQLIQVRGSNGQHCHHHVPSLPPLCTSP
jgi:hypothetical protein